MWTVWKLASIFVVSFELVNGAEAQTLCPNEENVIQLTGRPCFGDLCLELEDFAAIKVFERTGISKFRLMNSPGKLRI